MCMVKHGNPLAEVTMVTKGEQRFIVVGPLREDSTDRLAAGAMGYAVRYARLACLAFASYHVHNAKKEVLETFRVHFERGNELNSALARRFGQMSAFDDAS